MANPLDTLLQKVRSNVGNTASRLFGGASLQIAPNSFIAQTATKFLPSMARSFYNSAGPGNLVNAANKGINYLTQRSSPQVMSTQIDRNLDLSQKLRSQGNIQGSDFLLRKTYPQTAQMGQQVQQLSSLGNQARTQAALGVGKTALTLSGAKFVNPVSLGIGGLFGAGMSKLTGGNPYESAGQAIGQTPSVLGLSRFTGPIGSALTSKFGSVAQQTLGRTFTGAVNLAENEVLSRLDEKVPGISDRLMSFGLGAIMSGKANEQAVNKFLSTYEAKVPPEVKKQINDLVKTVAINFKTKVSVWDPVKGINVKVPMWQYKLFGDNAYKLNAKMSVPDGEVKDVTKGRLYDVSGKTVSLIDEAKNAASPEEFAKRLKGKTIRVSIDELRPSMGEAASHRPGGGTTSYSKGPIEVSASPYNDSPAFVIDDGNHRYREAISRGEKTVEVKVSETADELTEYWQKIQGTHKNVGGYWQKVDVTKPPVSASSTGGEITAQTPLYRRTKNVHDSFTPGKEVYFDTSKARSNEPANIERFGTNQIQATTNAKIADITGKGSDGLDYGHLPKEIQNIVKLPRAERTIKLKEMGYGGYKSGTEVVVFDPKNVISSGEIPKGGVTPPASPELPSTKTKEVPQVAKEVPKVSQGSPVLPAQGGMSGGGSKPVSSTSIVSPQGQPFYNVERMGVTKNTKQAVLETIQEVKPAIDKVVGKVLSHNEVIETARKTKTVLEGTIGRDQTEELGAMALNLRNKLASMAEKDASDPDFIELLIQDKAFGANLARLLGQRRIVSDTNEGLLVNKLIANVLKNNDNIEEILKAAKTVDFNDLAQATKFYRTFVKPKASDWIDLLRYNSMLSSPNTHINNAFSNFQGSAIIAPIEKTISGSIDFLSSKLTGKARTQFAGEAPEYIKGYWSNVGNAAGKFLNVMKGIKLSSMQEVYEIPLATGGRLAKLEKQLGFATRVLKASDEFFQTMTEGGATRALQYRESKGVAVGDIAEKAYLEGRKRLFNAEFNLPEEGYVLKTLEALPKAVAQWRSSKNPVLSQVSKIVFPFVRIPANILKASVEYGPLGVTTLPGAKNKTQQLAKAIMGSGVGLGVAMLVSADRMTWGEPVNQTQKDAFKAAGMQPYAIKVGDKWYSYAKLHPSVAFPIALVAAIRDANLNKRLDDGQAETMLNGVAKWLNFFADASYVKNIGDFVSATKGDAQGLTRFVSNIPQQFIPFRAFLSWTNRMIDPYQRQADPDGSVFEKQFQQIMSQLPIMSMTVPARVGPNGQPIKNPEPFINALSPIKVSTENPEMKAEYERIMQNSRNTKYNNDVKKLLKQGKPIPNVGQVGAYEQSPEAPKNIVEKISLAAQGIGVDPENTIKAIFTQERMRKVSGNAMILERQQYLNNTPDKTDAVDHIIPLSLGGTNDPSNLRTISKEANAEKAKLETRLARELRSGTITKEEARKQVAEWVRTYESGDPVTESPQQLTEDKYTIDTVKQQVKTTGKPQEYNGVYYYPTPKGTVTSVPTDLTIPQRPKYTGQTELDKELKSDYVGEVTKEINNVMERYKNQLITQEQANADIAKLKGYKASGGSRGKKAPKPKFKKFTMGKVPKITSPRFGKIKVKKIKMPKYKPVKFAKIKVRKAVK